MVIFKASKIYNRLWFNNNKKKSRKFYDYLHTWRYFSCLVKYKLGNATKLIIPSDMQNLATNASTMKEIVFPEKDTKKSD